MRCHFCQTLGKVMDSSEEKYQRMAVTMHKVANELKGESERGCVVLAFAWMDDQLTINLRKFLLPSAQKTTKADELLGVGRPVGDAATKIDLCLRLGLLHQHTHKSLHMFRRLRNDFAHLASEVSFSMPEIHDRVLAIFDNEEVVLRALWESIVEDPEVRAATEHDRNRTGPQILRTTLGTRRLFEHTAASLVAGLISIEYALAPIKPPGRVSAQLVEREDACLASRPAPLMSNVE